MKKLVTSFALFCCLAAQAKDVVLVTGFDAFGGAKKNHSWVIAESISALFQNDPEIEVVICQLPTTYAGAYPKLAECYDQLPKAPAFVLALGEGPCELNLETQVYNLDHNPKKLIGGSDPDNDGVHRNRRAIIAGAPFHLGLRVDVGSLYCALSPQERATTMISATPGNFVCNNASYQFTTAHPEVPFTFAHVVGQKCENKPAKLRAMPLTLAKVIRQQVALTKAPAGSTPHVANTIRMPVFRSELSEARNSATGCEKEFYGKLHADMIK